MAKRRVKRRKYGRRFKRSFNRRGRRLLGRYRRRAQQKIWRVPRKELGARNCFIRVKTQYFIPCDNDTDVAFKDNVLTANSLEPSALASQRYQSPPLWELATLYNYYHIYKSKIDIKIIDKTNSAAGIDAITPIPKMAYIFPSIDQSAEIVDPAYFGWSITALTKMNNPGSIPAAHYKIYNTHQMIYGGKPYCQLKHGMKTKRMWNFPVDQEAFVGDITAGGSIGSIASQDLTITPPTNKWYWHYGVIGMNATESGTHSSGSVVNAEVLVTLYSYVRLFGPKRTTQYSEII